MLDYAAIARFINMSVRAVKRWVAAGKLPAPDFRLGNIVRWHQVTIQKWLDKHQQTRR